MAAIGVLIIAGIVMIISIFVYKKVLDVGREEFTEKECQASLELTRMFELSPVCFVKSPNPIALHCSRSFITVKNDQVIKNGEELTDSYDATCPEKIADTTASKSSQACIAENVIAKSMAGCWNTFFEGQVPVFQQFETDEFDILEPDTTTKACYICAEIDIQTSLGAPQYYNYLKNAEHKKGLTYYEYFTSETAFCDPDIRKAHPSCWEGIQLNQDTTFWQDFWAGVGKGEPAAGPQIADLRLKQGKYAVAFVRRGMGTCEDKKTAKGDPDAALTLTVQLIPVEKVSAFCNMVVV